MDVRMPDGTIVTNVPDDMTQEDLLARYSSYTPAPVKENPIYGVAANITPSLASGIGGLMQMPGQLADLVTGTAPGEQAGIGRNIISTLLPFASKTVQESGESLQKVGQEAKTLGLQQKEKERAERLQQTEGALNKFGTAFADTVSDPSLISSFLFEQIPNVIGTGIGGLITKGAGKLLMKNASEQALSRIGVSGAVGTGVAMQGADIGYDTYKDIYERLVKEGTSPEEANTIALQKGRVAAVEAAGLSYATSKIPGAREVEKLMFKKSLSPAELAKSGTKAAAAKGFGKGAAGETLGENIEEIGGQFASNIGKQEVFPETSLTEGLGEAGAMATIGGATMGGVSGGINARREVRAAKDQALQKEMLDKGFVLEDRNGEQVYVNQKEDLSKAPEKENQPEIFYSETPLPQEMLDAGYVLTGQQEEDGINYYVYSKTPAEVTPPAQATLPLIAPPAATTAAPPVAPTVEAAAPPEATVDEPSIVEPPIVDPQIADSAASLPENVVLQNRGRNSPALIAQMNSIANTPDYSRVSVSNSFLEGAPVVFGSQTIDAGQLGRKATISSAKSNRKIPVQYAVLEADQLLPSNTVDGSSVPEYANPSFTGFKAVTNGRVAGLKEGYTRGTMNQYKQDLIADDIHGIKPDVIAGMKNPVLVRVMPQNQVTADIADESNTSSTLTLSATEQAKNDANRIDLDGLMFRDDGAISPETVRGFIAAMPQAEQQQLIDKEGRPSRQAYDRLNAAIFQKAYGNDALVALAAEAKTVDAANIINGLLQAAPQMAKLANAGEYYIRPQVVQAAETAINANRQGQKLSDVMGQQDFLNQDPIIQSVLQLFANNTRSSKKIGAGLRQIATDLNTEATRSQEPDMFGEVPARKSASAIVEESANIPADQVSQESTEEEQGLKAPTAAELKAQQDAIDKAAADKAKADRETDAKAKADAERKEVAARSEKAASEFVLGKTAEEGLSGQTDIFSTPVQISPEQQKIDALNKLEAVLLKAVPSFRAKSAGSTSILRPKPLSAPQMALIKDLAGEAIDQGVPASVFANISAAGATRMDATAAIASARGWLLLGKTWASSSRAAKLQSIIHELGHSVDKTKINGVETPISEGNAWSKANDELKNWYDTSNTKTKHPFAYPFDKQFKDKVILTSESFAQAFSFYFVSPVDLQTNAPEAYSQIQSIVEGIQNESQRSGAASATKTSAVGVKVQPSRTPKDTTIQSEAGKVGSGVSQAERVQDRDNERVDEIITLPQRGATVPSTGMPRLSIVNQPIEGTWLAAPETRLTPLVYKFQDKQVDLKDVQKQIEATTGRIDDALNAYRKETLYYGRVADQTEKFLNSELKPLLKELSDKKISLDEIDNYLQALHAQERNDSIAKKLGGMADGGSGMTTADAKKLLAGIPADKLKDLQSLATRVRKIIAGTQAIEVQGGLEQQSKIDGWNKTWPNYVPLFRTELDYVTEGSGMGQGFSTRGSSSKRAVGSDKPVKEILASVAEQRQKAIVRSEKARVGKSLFALAIANPNPDYWLAIDPASKKSLAQTRQMLLDYGFDPADVTQLMQNIAQEPKTASIKKVYNPVTKKFDAIVRYNINQQNRFSTNVLPVRINGEDKYLFFNPNNERAKRMVQSIKNLDAEQLGELTQVLGTVTRFIAALSTQYNPIFGAWNFARDVQAAALNLTTTPLRDKKAEVVAGAFKAMRGIYKETRTRRKGGQAQGHYSDLYRDMEASGGKTGFINQFTSFQKKGTIVERELKNLNQGNVKKVASVVVGWLSDYNDTLENVVRLSAYEQALKLGLSKEESAEIAKNITVNFNRKGAKTAGIGALYAFFNSAVQGTTRMIETLRGPAGRRIIAGGFLLGAFQAALLAMADFDEDDPSEFIKQKNLIFPTGDGGYVMIPMPLGFNILPNIGRILSEMAFGDKKSGQRKVTDLMEAVVSSFNPLGGGNAIQISMPTIADPIANVIMNRDAFGRPISKEDRATSPSPGYLRSRESAGEISKGIAEFINYISLGSEFNKGGFSPTGDDINYVVKQYLGGVGREIGRAAEYVAGTSKGEAVEPYKIPILGKIYGDLNAPASVANKFYVNVTEMAKHENELKGLAPRGEAPAYLRDNPSARYVKDANRLENEISKLNKTKKQLFDKNPDDERIQRIDDQKLRMMKTFNDRVRQVER